MSKPIVRVKAGDEKGVSARSISANRSAYVAADMSHPSMMGWHPWSGSADADWLRERDIAVPRLRDMERNNGWAGAGVDRIVDMMVGASLRLNPKPDPDGLGVSFEAAHAYGRDIQRAWRKWANDPIFRCDSERELPFVGQAGLVAREFVGAPGESLAIVRWIERPGWPFRTAVQVVDPDRLSNPMGQPDTPELRSGVAKDKNNAPIGYHFRRAHPGEGFMGGSAGAFEWDYVPRWVETFNGHERPNVLHVKDKRRPGQTRGISKFVANIANSRGMQRVTESEIRSAAINASIVGALYTQLGADYAAERMGASTGGEGTDWEKFINQRSAFYEGRTPLEYEKFLTLFPSDRLDLNTQPRQTAGFPQFQMAFLQSFAASLGISYEQLSMDWSHTNYSSARAALNEVWRTIGRLRAILVWAFALPVYTAFLEDALDSGEIEPPAGAVDFYDDPYAHLRSDWIGPGRGYTDPLKEAQGATNRMDGQISTLEKEAAEQGEDWEDTLDQLARENIYRENLGLASPSADYSLVPRTDLPDSQPG